ncbi:MAG: hypothetical protein ILM98_08250, partial [Kiritimatiellae bacterium]|nr:hypothetical protein [Kiritimatiellia bacterium]
MMKIVYTIAHGSAMGGTGKGEGGMGNGSGGSQSSATDEYIATTASLVIDRTAKPAKDSKTSTTISNLTESTTFYAVFTGDPLVSAIP